VVIFAGAEVACSVGVAPNNEDVFLAVFPRLNRLLVGGGPAGVKELVLPKEKPVLFVVGVVEPDAAGVEELFGMDPNKLVGCPVLPAALSAGFPPNPKPALPEPPADAPPKTLLVLFWSIVPNGLVDVFPNSEGAALLLA